MDHLVVVVHTREGIVFRGKASAVSSKNRKGPFDVLHTHANFVTTLYESVVVHSTGAQPFTKTFDHGLLWVRSGALVDVYIGIGAEATKSS